MSSITDSVMHNWKLIIHCCYKTGGVIA